MSRIKKKFKKLVRFERVKRMDGEKFFRRCTRADKVGRGNRISDFHGPDSRRCHNLELPGREVRTTLAFTEVEQRGFIYLYLRLYISRNLNTAKINIRRIIASSLMLEIQICIQLVNIWISITLDT